MICSCNHIAWQYIRRGAIQIVSARLLVHSKLGKLSSSLFLAIRGPLCRQDKTIKSIKVSSMLVIIKSWKPCFTWCWKVLIYKYIYIYLQGIFLIYELLIQLLMHFDVEVLKFGCLQFMLNYITFGSGIILRVIGIIYW